MGFLRNSKNSEPEVDASTSTANNNSQTTTKPKPKREPFFKYRYSEETWSASNNLAPPQPKNSEPLPDASSNASQGRRKSWYDRWKNLTNPHAEFSDEEIKRRTGMTGDEFRAWVQDPKNVEESRKYRPSDIAWAVGGGGI